MKEMTSRALTISTTMALLFFQSVIAQAEPITEAFAIEVALDQNPTLRAAVLDLRAAQEALRAAESVHRPSIQVGVDGGHNEMLSATMSGVAPNADDRVGLDVGLSYASKVGTELSIEVGGAWRSREVNRDPSTTTNVAIGSNYGLDATVGVSQPLLRGAGRDVGEADIRRARHSKSAAEHARDRAASELVQDVLGAYWELWYAQEVVKVNRSARELAQRQLGEAEAKVGDLGTLARIEALRFSSELATIEEQLSQAETDQRGRAVELGRLLGRLPGEAVDTVTAGTAPAVVDGEAPLPTVEELIDATRRASSELRQLAEELEVARDRVLVARDSTLPRLDLSASLAVGGLWDEDTITTGGLPNDRPALSGQLGLELELPLGNARARAALSEASLQAEAAGARLEAQERRIHSEVVTRLDALRSARRRAELARQSMEIATELVEAEQGALRLGTSTALQVLEAQTSLRETELRYLRVLVDQRGAETALNHLTGSLLERYAVPRAAVQQGDES